MPHIFRNTENGKLYTAHFVNHDGTISDGTKGIHCHPYKWKDDTISGGTIMYTYARYGQVEAWNMFYTYFIEVAEMRTPLF